MGLEETRPDRRRFGRYELLYCFASGGMADLYLARLTGEEGFERLLAVKVIHPHLSRQSEFVKMFIDEARLASRISHPNIALTLELGRVGTTHFIAMEYVDGESIASLLHKTRPPVPYSARIISDAAAGLHSAHELRGADGQPLGVVHRDISPANVLVSYEGAVKVVDFGVARVRGSLHTTSNAFKGKYGYMSPEQFSAPQSVDRRTDVFALGVVLFEMTTWRRLFKAATEAETVERVLRAEVPRPTALEPDYPPALERIVLRALDRAPERRQQTAVELHEELEGFIASCGTPVPSSAIGRMMQQVFADRIAEKRALLAKLPSTPSALPLRQEQPTASSVSLRSSIVTFPGRRRRLAMIAAAGGLAVAAAVVLYAALGDPPRPLPSAARTEPAPRTRADAAPSRVTISVRATPANATITLGGRAMTNPFEIQRPAAASTLELLITAPGFRSQRFEVPLARGGSWTVALVVDPPPSAVKPRAKSPSGGKSSKTPTAGKSRFLENPYK